MAASFRAAVVQMRSGTEPARNVETLERLVAQAAGQGAHYVQTPEMTGALIRDKERFRAVLAAEADDAVVEAASALARRHSIVLHIGSTAVDAGEGKAANRAFLFGPDGARVETYDKIHMFDVDLDGGESWRESNTYRAGTRASVADLTLGGTPVRLGFAVCYDIRFPALFAAQALAGAEVLTAPAAFTRQTGEAHWHVLQRARAIENGAFLVSAAQGGLHEDGRETYGHSLIVDPWGRVIAEIEGDDPGVAVAEIEIGAVASARAKIPNLANRRSFAADFVPRPAAAAR